MTGILEGIFTRVAARPEKREDLLTVSRMFYDSMRDASGVVVTPESALKFSAVFACVRILAETLGSLPLIIYQRQGNSRQRALDHPLYSILHDSPNEMMTAIEFREAMMGYLALRGNAIAQIEYDGRGRVTELWPLRWENVQEIRVDRENGQILYYYQNPDGKFQWLSSNTVWHLRGWASDGITGYSPVSLARRSVGLGLAAEEFGARFFGNDARPGVVLEHPGTLSGTTQENLKKTWAEEHEGVSKSHRISILEEGMKLHEIGIPPEDAQFLQTRQFQVTEIARWFHIPPHMIADLDRATFSNIEHQGIEFVTYTMRSWFVRWEQSIGKHLILPAERKDYYAEFLVDALLRGDTPTRYQAYQSGIQAGWLTRADAREKENLEPIDGLEEPLVPMNMTTIGNQGQAPAGQQTNDLQPEIEERTMKAAITRRRLMNSYKRIFKDVAERIMRKEINDVRVAANKAFGARASLEFDTWLDDYYNELPAYIRRQLGATARGYADMVSAAASDEIDKEHVPSDELDRFVSSYVGAVAIRHVSKSKAQLQAAVARAQENGTDALAEVNDQLDYWNETRSETISNHESVQENNAVAKFVYAAAGIVKIRSVAFGKNCPYCTHLNGKTIGIEEWFIPAGGSLKPDGVEKPLTSSTDIGHPPYHDGCDCMIMAGI